MAPLSPADEERKARIISTVNRDHRRMLSHLLRRHTSLSSSAASPPSACALVDIHLKYGVLIRAPSGKEYQISFDDNDDADDGSDSSTPRGEASWADVEARIIAMGNAARAALGISDVHITRSPTFGLLDWASYAFIFFFVGCVATLPYVRPGSGAWGAIDAVFPGGVGVYRSVVKAVTWPALAIHVAEALAFDRLRMRRHDVPRWSALWWKWEINVFIQGYGAWKKIGAFVDEERKKQSKTK
ncbi:hypothetical protein ESCO_001694 [Escovopsis weberi]|uniref:DUF2470 domain-containing protein n=1 Tax=Escovopsis weberi TaxID=150374 RepID=A0A0M9VW59_ESCWE|nr:hypothetical protein ESCO_001694 [Escovopsis weberi]